MGDSLNNYNMYTLSPVGVENEDEENDGEDGEHKQGDNSGASNDKPTGISYSWVLTVIYQVLQFITKI